MDARQKQALQNDLLRLWGAAPEPPQFHHGDCIGSDEQAAKLARAIGYRIISHPPVNHYARAFFPSDEERVTKPFLERNRDIVNETEILLAAVAGPEQVRSGTWSTVRYARKIGRKVVILSKEQL